MTDLKTLKDLETEYEIGDEFDHVCKSSELRLEAQKWVEYLKEEKCSCYGRGNGCSHDRRDKNKIEWVEMFFNLKDGGK